MEGYLSKTDLIDGAYYEGFNEDNDSRCVAKWDSKDNLFISLYYSWEDTYTIPMTHNSEDNEYYGKFFPISRVEAKSFEEVGR